LQAGVSVILQKTADGVILELSVKPNAKKFEIQIDGDTVLVLVPEAPMKGKVNKELLKRLSKMFANPWSWLAVLVHAKKSLLSTTRHPNS
jgi:uncharacterized protein (TIGR00251 family)